MDIAIFYDTQTIYTQLKRYLAYDDEFIKDHALKTWIRENADNSVENACEHPDLPRSIQRQLFFELVQRKYNWNLSELFFYPPTRFAEMNPVKVRKDLKKLNKIKSKIKSVIAKEIAEDVLRLDFMSFKVVRAVMCVAKSLSYQIVTDFEQIKRCDGIWLCKHCGDYKGKARGIYNHSKSKNPNGFEARLDVQNNYRELVRRFIREDKAATIIQKYWRECIANPSYEMCKKRLLKECDALSQMLNIR